MGKYFFKSREPFLKCPKCSKPYFGVLNVGGTQYVRRCNECDYSQRFKLLKPNKRLVYIDQYAISFDAKMPTGRSHKKWPEIKRAIEHSLHMEAIACPYSEFHENESTLCGGLSDDLRKAYKHFARGESFRPTVFIELAQIGRALRRYVKEPDRTGFPVWRDILDKDPHVWTDNIFITMNTEKARDVEATARQVKEQISARLDELNKTFKESKKSFEEQYPLELRQVGINMMKIYKNEIARLMLCKTPAEMMIAKMDGSVFADQVEYILKFFTDRGADSKEKWRHTVAFLQSEDFFSIDYVRINAALWAGLARRVGIGQAEVRASDYNDVPIVSHYAPYCEAMLIDDAMRDILVTNPVKDTLQLKTKFFSPNCFDAFIAYLHSVVDELPHDFKTEVSEVHGELKNNN